MGNLTPFFLFSLQHDPDDEPVAPPLDPEFFEFDCRCSFHPSVAFHHVACSTQRRHQSRAAQGAIIRGDYELQANHRGVDRLGTIRITNAVARFEYLECTYDIFLSAGR